jgi:hypothetical protein
MTSEFSAHFASNYQCLLNRLKLYGMQPKNIALYSHEVRRAGEYFDYRILGKVKPEPQIEGDMNRPGFCGGCLV